MAISVQESSFVGDGQQIGLSSLFSVSAKGTNPTYLVLTGLDRNEYTAGAGKTTGTLHGNGNSAGFSSIGGDGRGVGVVFSYDASSGRYYNETYGYFDQMSYTLSSSAHDVTNLSLFGTNNLSLAQSYGNNAFAMESLDAAGYLGSATIVTQSHFGTVPTQATPNSICAVAQSFVGQAWNMNGCWVLASTIAAEAGASLPIDSTMMGVSGQSNGEWFVAFDGTKQTGNWQSMVKAGEIVVIGNSTFGHITTCVAGSGSSAMLIDNITYVNSNGSVANSANDGSSQDIKIAAAHLATQEWANVSTSLVKIYELDCPVVSDLMTRDTIKYGASQSLSYLFSAADPLGKAITQYQVYDTSNNESFIVSGAQQSAHSAATALTVSSLSAISLSAGNAADTDTLEVRAFNGTYWGDWQALSVSVTDAAAAPILINQTANQVWRLGQKVSLALPANTFFDPDGQTLSYNAVQANGQALPDWLKFDAASATFSGTVPTGAQSLSVKVTATDTSKLSASETFAITVAAAPPVVTHQTDNQIWHDGDRISFTLPANTFTDPQDQHLTYSAYQIGGASIVSWLRFNPTTDTFSGAVPLTATGTVTLEVIAKNASGLTATDIFHVTFAALGTEGVSVVGVPTPSVHGLELLALQ
jgi:hypothetical protein